VSGTVSPKAWADAVVKQIRKTARRTATGRGTVQIGFTVGKDGSLQAVKVLTSSGVAQVDAMGMDHIRRAAPFPAPPTDANRNLAFVFELQ
jgi:protein TonB